MCCSRALSRHGIDTLSHIFQPVGVGFSHGDTPPINETQVAEDFFAFFQNWLGVFEDYQHKKVWITGESYAGECAWVGVCWQQ